MKAIQIKNFTLKNKILILSLIFFLLYRYFFTWLLFNGRSVPPEPDDSYYYLSIAARFPTLNSFEDYRLFYFSAWLKFLSVFTFDNLENAYKLNFFITPIFLLMAIYYFLKKTETNKKIIPFLIFILTFYSGSGAYHGFYWAVPSLFQLLLFFTILGLLASKEKVPISRIFLFGSLFIFSHPTSIFISLIFSFNIIFLYFFDKDSFNQSFRKVIILFASFFISFAAYLSLSKLYPANVSPQSFQSNLNLITNFIQGYLKPDTFLIIWKEYFAIFTFNPIATMAYALMIFLLFANKNAKLISLYLSCLLLVLISSFIPYGSRTLAFLWPTTFLIIAYCAIYLYRIMVNYNFKYLIIIPIVFFAVLTTIFNQISIRSINGSKSYRWDRNCSTRLENQNVLFQSLEGMFAFSIYTEKDNYFAFLSDENLSNNLSSLPYIVKTGNLENSSNPKFSKYESYLMKKITRREMDLIIKNQSNYWTQSPLSNPDINSILLSNNLRINYEFNCGYYQIYKIN